jgi:hypothetical protein
VDEVEALQDGADNANAHLAQQVLGELLAARKTTEGLSPNAMAQCPVMVGLLGDGDPLVAFTRLQARVLETLELGDDVMPIEAAAYSLGLSSGQKTHLDRLNDFGTEFGYEARQARRLSDKGIRQLAQLVASNWVVHAVPTLELFVAQQRDGSLVLTLRTRRQRFVDMAALTVRREAADGREPVPASGETQADSSAQDDSLWVKERLAAPIRLPVEELSENGASVRFVWHGEMWPRFSVTMVGPIAPDTLLTTQTLGATLLLTWQRVDATPPADQQRP